MDEKLDDGHRRERKWLVNLPTIIFIIVIIASLILGGYASVRASQTQTSTSNTQTGQSVYVLVVISGNTTYTTTVTRGPCSTGQVEVIVQPILIENSNQNITTTTTYTTTKC